MQQVFKIFKLVPSQQPIHRQDFNGQASVLIPAYARHFDTIEAAEEVLRNMFEENNDLRHDKFVIQPIYILV